MCHMWISYDEVQLRLIKIRIGYQKKGWTDGEIGAKWMKIFEEQTREKADSKHRLLLLDGHNSHFTVEFLSSLAFITSLFSVTLPTVHTFIKALTLSYFQFSSFFSVRNMINSCERQEGPSLNQIFSASSQTHTCKLSPLEISRPPFVKLVFIHSIPM